MGRIPTGEQTYGYSKAFQSSNNTYSAKPIAIPTMILMKPMSSARNKVACYGPRNQR